MTVRTAGLAAAVNSVGLGVSILGCVLAMVGAFLVFAGRGGPDDWGQR